MKTSTLNKLTPQGREEVIRLEARLREIQEEKKILDKEIEVIENGAV
jgi:hypothetical protein